MADVVVVVVGGGVGTNDAVMSCWGLGELEMELGRSFSAIGDGCVGG